MEDLGQAKIIITNLHAFKPRELVNAGKLTKDILTKGQNNSLVETPDQMVRRVCRELGSKKSVIVINDEAHHCYRRRAGGEDIKLVGDERKEAEKREEEAKAKPKSNLDFRVMSLTYKFRDFRLPRMSILKEVGIKAGFHVLDYGCGPGSYITPVSRLVGNTGRIYALDVHPLAIKAVQRLASKKGLTNVQTILSDCNTGLLPNSLDVILLYDILHHLDDYSTILTELHRILKPKGILSVSDHHMKQDEILSRVTSRGLFKLSAQGKRTYSFMREER